MNKLMQGIERFWKEEEGTEVVEWALVAGLIVAVGAGIIATIGGQAKVALEAVSQIFTDEGYAAPTG